MRDGDLEQTRQVIDLCLVSTDVLKKMLQKQWADEADMRNGVDSLLAQIAEFAPVEVEDGELVPAAPEESAPASATAAPAARVNTGDKQDRKSTRLNSSHLVISYAVFCLKKKN